MTLIQHLEQEYILFQGGMFRLPSFELAKKGVDFKMGSKVHEIILRQ